jgi:hypothetical protein
MLKTTVDIRRGKEEKLATFAVVLLSVVVVSLCFATGAAAAKSASYCATVTGVGEVTEQSLCESKNADRLRRVGDETEYGNSSVQVDRIDHTQGSRWESAGRVPSFLFSLRVSNHESLGRITDPSIKKQANSDETNESMENIDSTLVQLIEATDREEFAEKRGIEYRNGRARVVVEMEENSTFPGGYDTTDELNYTGQGKNLAQAYVPVDGIVSLSDETGVERVRLPLRGVPNQGNEREEEQTPDGGVPNGSTEDSETSGSQDPQRTNGSDDQKEEGLPSVMGGILPALIVILVAAYGRRKI